MTEELNWIHHGRKTCLDNRIREEKIVDDWMSLGLVINLVLPGII